MNLSTLLLSTDTSTDNWRSVARRGNGTLNVFQQLNTKQWIPKLSKHNAVMLNIGANTHEKMRTDPDPAPLAVQSGWRSILVEPIPQNFEGLQQTYRSRSSSQRVRLAQAAVCETCDEAAKQIYFVDMTNATGNWGTNRSDARCLHTSGYFGWVKELASFDPYRIYQHERLLVGARRGHERCTICSQELGRPLPDDCVYDVIKNNIASVAVPCFCMATEVRLQANEPAVTLLVIDTEGFDQNVLLQYPFETLPTMRVVFEANKMPNRVFDAICGFLHRHGYIHLSGGYKSAISTWHHRDATPSPGVPWRRKGGQRRMFHAP